MCEEKCKLTNESSNNNNNNRSSNLGEEALHHYYRFPIFLQQPPILEIPEINPNP